MSLVLVCVEARVCVRLQTIFAAIRKTRIAMGVRTMHEFTLQLVLVSVHKIHQILQVQGDDAIPFDMTLYRLIKESVIECLS